MTIDPTREHSGDSRVINQSCAFRREDIDSQGYIRVLGKGGDKNIVPVGDVVVETPFR